MKRASVLGIVMLLSLLPAAARSKKKAENKGKSQLKATAEQYASGMSEWLAEIEKQIASQQKREVTFYAKERDLLNEIDEADVFERLDVLREERVEKLSAEWPRSGLNLQQIHQALRTAQAEERDIYRTFFAGDAEAGTRYAASVTQLKRSTQALDGIHDALTQLAKPTSSGTKLKNLGEFGNAVKDNYDELVCGDLKQEKEKLSQLTDASLKAQKTKEIDQKLKDKGCK